MQQVTKAGPQKACCVIEDCDRPPAGINEVYCKGHLEFYRDGSPATPPIIQPDDPALLAATAQKAAAQEAEEYRERRRVKTWKTLENGTRVPEEYWTDEELAVIEAEVVASMNVRHVGGQISMSRELMDETRRFTIPLEREEDPVKAATRVFKRALRGKLGELAKEHAWSTVRILDDMQ